MQHGWAVNVSELFDSAATSTLHHRKEPNGHAWAMRVTDPRSTTLGSPVHLSDGGQGGLQTRTGWRARLAKGFNATHYVLVFDSTQHAQSRIHVEGASSWCAALGHCVALLKHHASMRAIINFNDDTNRTHDRLTLTLRNDLRVSEKLARGGHT